MKALKDYTDSAVDVRLSLNSEEVLVVNNGESIGMLESVTIHFDNEKIIPIVTLKRIDESRSFTVKTFTLC